MWKGPDSGAVAFQFLVRRLVWRIAVRYNRYVIGNDSEARCVDITFRTSRLARVFNSDRDLKRTYGDRMTRRIQTRMAILKNSRTLDLVPTTPPDRRHQLTGDRRGQFAVDLVHPRRIVFVPNHHPVPLRDDGGMDLEQITAITILEVVDYH